MNTWRHAMGRVLAVLAIERMPCIKAFVGGYPVLGTCLRRGSFLRDPSAVTLLGTRHDRATTQHTRRRRGALHASQRTTLLSATRYTIDDTVCPPTEAETLSNIVQKHVRTLPKYWTSKPIAAHTAEAFEEALAFIQRWRASKEEGQRTKVILDSGCGTGRSSFLLGDRHPDCVVLGIE